MASKYKAPWVAGEFNTEFWNEVLVDRRIRTAMYENGRFSVVLDSGETVYFSGALGWDRLDMIAPAPAGPVGQKITALEWDATGISALCLEVGRILLDRETPGRLCIKDDPHSTKDIEAQAVYRIELPESISEEEAQALVARVRTELEAEGIKLKPDDGTLTLEYVSGEVPKPEMVDSQILGEIERQIGLDLAAQPSQSFEITGKLEDGKLEVLSVKEIESPPPTDEWFTKMPSGKLVRGIPVQQVILDEAQTFKEIERDNSGRPGTLDAPKPTEGYARTCRTCGKTMLHQAWSSSDGAHEDSKYTCPDGHVEWVDGIDS